MFRKSTWIHLGPIEKTFNREVPITDKFGINLFIN
jgi:hypothetical protein